MSKVARGRTVQVKRRRGRLSSTACWAAGAIEGITVLREPSTRSEVGSAAAACRMIRTRSGELRSAVRRPCRRNRDAKQLKQPTSAVDNFSVGRRGTGHKKFLDCPGDLLEGKVRRALKVARRKRGKRLQCALSGVFETYGLLFGERLAGHHNVPGTVQEF
jgi:hypothetical protein